MTRYEAIVKVLNETPAEEYAKVSKDILAKLVLEAIEAVELKESNNYEQRYLLGLRDSQASAFQEDINERKARQ